MSIDGDAPVAGGYRNPVIPGFHPDPSVCRVGDEYVLATSSFTYFPGVPIFRSTDLVTWTQIGNALDRVSQLDLTGTDDFSSGGVFAPTIRHHDGRFWMITTVFSSTGVTNFFVTAVDPARPWSEPVPVPVLGIDPDLAWDDDGNCWVHFSAGGILRARIDDRTGEVLDGPVPAWAGTALQFPEAPHLFRRGDRWYLLIAEGGTERGHAVTIARGTSPTGPWESCPANPILSHRSTDRPIQNTGHGDLVEATDGSWWMVLLGTRPRGITPMYHVLGRETFLVPVDWVDGWPVPRDLELDMPTSPPGPHTGEASRVVTTSTAPRWDRSGSRSVGRSATPRPSPNDPVGSRCTDANVGLDHPWPVFVGRRQQHLRCRTRALRRRRRRGRGRPRGADERAHPLRGRGRGRRVDRPRAHRTARERDRPEPLPSDGRCPPARDR